MSSTMHTKKWCMDESGMSASEALNEIYRLLETDGDPFFDLGSYTTVSMEPEADRLIRETIKKNLANKNEYKATANIQKLVINGIASMLHAPEKRFGTSTVGSSEGAFLALLGARFAWRKGGGKGTSNIVLSSNAHLCWYRAASFLDTEVREVVLPDLHNYPLQPVLNQIDENTLLVIVTLGCTNVGLVDPVSQVHQAVLSLNEEHQWNVGIHVDAAIGGFVFPFLNTPGKTWDFRLSTVRSVNISGHKYGLVYPGVGWLIFRDQSCFDKSLFGSYHYLFGVSKSATVNFSQSACFILGQYFNFLCYGYSGYCQMVEESFEKVAFLSNQIQAHNGFDVIPDTETPIVVFGLSAPNSDRETISRFCELMRSRKWMLPHYELPVKHGREVMRIVIRKDMSWPRLRLLTKDLVEVFEHLL